MSRLDLPVVVADVFGFPFVLGGLFAGGIAYGTADNAINPDGSANTAHSLNPATCIYVTERKDATVADGKLADVAPTMFKIMDIPQPVETTGHALIN